MRTIRAISDIKQVTSRLSLEGKSIGLVPTMGALHHGHIELVKASIIDNEITIVSIFVNPMQFNNTADLKAYPRDLNGDLEKLRAIHVDFAFVPEVGELYPSKPTTQLSFGSMSEVLEGIYRKGHFEGVGLVVSKLFHLISPTHAYFGLKDLQQFLIIKKMCHDLNFPVAVKGLETVREPSGLALSSRNRRLSEEGKQAATIIYNVLTFVKQGIVNQKKVDHLMKEAHNMIDQEKRFQLEYLSLVDASSLQAINDYDGVDELAVCMAGYVEGVRLIDNLYLRSSRN